MACLALVLAANPLASIAAPIKVDEGFASRVTEDNEHNPRPANTVTQINAGEGVYYWIKWKNYPNRTTVRCVVNDSDGETVFDENYIDEDNPTDQYTVCGGETDAKDFDTGRYTFIQYLDGDRVGEQSINIERAYTFKISRYRKFKWTVSAIIIAVVGGLWLFRKMRGDHAGAAEVFASKASRKMENDPDFIAAKAKGASSTAPSAASKAEDDLKTAGQQFQSAMALPDKKMGLEAGKRYITQLLDARRNPEAVGVFKMCLAADPAFRPARPEEALPLAKAARAMADPNAAIAALRGFDKLNPGHSTIPEVYLLSAQILAEDLKNTAMARKILEHILAKFPGHHVAQEAKRCLQALPA